MSSSLPRLTSLSTQTLTLLLERQRLQSLSGPAESSVSLPSSSLAQITRNLTHIRAGIHELEEQQRQHSGGSSASVEASKLLREQFERMREMMGGDKDKVEP
jgi:syntaxin 8